MILQGLRGGSGVLAGYQAHTHLRPGRRDQGVGGFRDGGGIDGQHGGRGFEPHPFHHGPVADLRDPLEQPGLLQQPILGVVEVGSGAGDETLDRNVPGIVVQGRQQPAQRGQRVRHHPTELPRVQPLRQGGDGDLAVRDTPQRRGQRRLADLPVDGVGDDVDVGGQFVAVAVEQRRHARRPDLLLALDEHLHPDRWFAVEDP